MMLERLLYKAIVDGIAAVTEDPSLLVEFFECEALLEHDEAVKIKDYFLANPPSVIHGYARLDAKFPLYAITLTSQGQGQSFVGDEGGFISDPSDPEFGSDQWASIFNYTYNIITYAQNPDVVIYYFHLLQRFIIGAENLFKNDANAYDLSYSGADMAPDSATMPAGLFMRRFQVSMSRQYTQLVEGSKLGRAWKVQGMHIDREGSVGSDVGGVRTNVRVAVMGGDDV